MTCGIIVSLTCRLLYDRNSQQSRTDWSFSSITLIDAAGSVRTKLHSCELLCVDSKKCWRRLALAVVDHRGVVR